jgi:hypothetical protein
MAGLTRNASHYIVHFTPVDPLPQSSYGTSAPYEDLATAIEGAWSEIKGRRRAFVTARDKNSGILAVIPVIDYPVAKETHVPEHAQNAITVLFADMNWTD